MNILWYQCRSFGVMQICSAIMRFTIEDRYLIKSCERARVTYGATCLCKMFSEEIWNITRTENSDKGN